jgi:outer membrane protein OmpU
MKKILLITTALVGFTASSAMADAPTITLSGYLNFEAGFSNQKKDYKVNEVTEASTKFAINNNIIVNAEGKTDYGLTYGGVIDLQGDDYHARTDASDNQLGDQIFVRQAYVYVQSAFGRIEAGSLDSVTHQLDVGPNQIARGTGGIDGDWSNYVNVGKAIYTDGTTQTSSDTTYPITPHLILDDSASTYANKVNYFTPVMMGFQAAAGFTPQSNQMGTAKGFNGIHTNPGAVARNIVNLDLNYCEKFGELDVKANAAGIFGKAVEVRNPTDAQKRNDLRAYNLGLALEYAGFTVAGNYGNTGKSLGLKNDSNADVKKSRFYSLGGAYQYNQIGTSITYLDGKQGGNKASVVSFAADYALADGFVPYIEATIFNLKPVASTTAGETAINQKGNVIIVGTKFNF